MSNQRWRYSDAGPIFNFTVKKNIATDSVYLSDLSYLPTWVFKGNTGVNREYIILPSEVSFYHNTRPYLSERDLVLMRESFVDMIRIMEPEGAKLVKTINYDIGRLLEMSQYPSRINNF
jgi:hypothetical protein